MQIERTLAIIKPDGLKYAIDIINMIYESNLSITKYTVRNLEEDEIKEHYAHLLDKPFFKTLKDYMLSDKVIIMVLEGDNAVNNFRELMGPTDPLKASKDTIRGKYGTNITINTVHGSDSVSNAEIEINRFFKSKQKKLKR